jgi:glycerophosphoryl diester phosphodiesterase
VEIIGHRGAAFDAPENTLASIRLAWEQAADAVECDVRLTRDGQIVAIHDPETKRIAGVDRLVSEQTLDELRRLDVGIWKGEWFGGEGIAPLSEILRTVPTGKRVFVEVKCGPEIIPELERVVAAAGLRPEQTTVISFSAEVIVAVKKELPALAAYWCVDLSTETFDGLGPLIESATAIRCDGLDLSADPAITADFVRQANAAGLPLFIWTVNDAGVARRLIAAGVAGITTDRPGWLRDQLKM